MKYTLESISEIKAEISILFNHAWHSVDYLAPLVPLDPDWDMIFQMEKLGMFRTYTVRLEDGLLIGYACVLVQPLIHSKGVYNATVDNAFIEPEHRGNFREFLEVLEEDLKSEGVHNFTFNIKSWDGVGKFFEKVGYTHIENVYIKVVN